METKRKKIIVLSGALLFSVIMIGLSAFAEEAEQAPVATGGLPLPRFVSLKTDEVNVRTGPALTYEIVWVYTHKNMPVEIIAEYEQWRKVKDSEGEEGWIHRSMLSNRRTVTIVGEDIVVLRRSGSSDGSIVARVEPGVHAELEGCEETHCRIEAKGYRGWVEREFLWGIYSNERTED